MSAKAPFNDVKRTHSKELDMVQDLVIEGEVIAGNNIDTSLFLDLPMFQTESLALAQQLLFGNLSCPERFGCFLEITVHTHARETEN
jgi:hypothetical protein